MSSRRSNSDAVGARDPVAEIALAAYMIEILCPFDDQQDRQRPARDDDESATACNRL
jgi:hypothetical protein